MSDEQLQAELYDCWVEWRFGGTGSEGGVLAYWDKLMVEYQRRRHELGPVPGCVCKDCMDRRGDPFDITG